MTMTNKEKYKQAFSALHASENISLEVNMKDKKRLNPAKRLVVACACAIMIFGVGVTVYANGEVILKRIFGWENNVEITDSGVMVHTDNLADPVKIVNGRMYFIVNNEYIDITDHVSQTEAYAYDYVDMDGNTHYWFIGLNGEELGNYGYGEYIKDSNGAWAGGYSARTNIEEDGSVPEWLERGKESINCPW
ncbi:MAG: hypothetical protein SO181_05440 [Frisingicoccus sp.]|uniref:hypothetical protein n=1 Tax=Frisingicoccus sp. TaxID=1918627 RepID=UPI002A805F91|nr:hypothetical protein [Frisingicoccus sp.]MDY4834580.1 hypothetical protein [Frisingicoccus sp.]